MGGAHSTGGGGFRPVARLGETLLLVLLAVTPAFAAIPQSSAHWRQIGDTVAARDVLERALLVAPHFGQARRLMAEIVSG